MEDWQLDFEWLRVRHYVKDAMAQSSLPDLEIILLLIGIQEAHIVKSSYTKEEKQDLMHIAVCHLLSLDGYFEWSGKDDEGWPHYRQIRSIPAEGEKAQTRLLKECIIQYFEPHTKEQIVHHEN